MGWKGIYDIIDSWSISLNLQFLGNGFDVMLFHYDGLVDEWNDLKWGFPVIHVSAMNQTKW